MPIVIRDTTVVTGDAARTVRHGASLLIDADRIAAIGPAAEIDQKYPGAERSPTNVPFPITLPPAIPE